MARVRGEAQRIKHPRQAYQGNHYERQPETRARNIGVKKRGAYHLAQPDADSAQRHAKPHGELRGGAEQRIGVTHFARRYIRKRQRADAGKLNRAKHAAQEKYQQNKPHRGLRRQQRAGEQRQHVQQAVNQQQFFKPEPADKRCCGRFYRQVAAKTASTSSPE